MTTIVTIDFLVTFVARITSVSTVTFITTVILVTKVTNVQLGSHRFANSPKEFHSDGISYLVQITTALNRA